MRVHILGNPIVPMDRSLTGDAFNQMAFRLAAYLTGYELEVFVYGSAHGLKEAPFCSHYVSTLLEEDFHPAVSLMSDLGGYVGFNSGQYLSAGAGSPQLAAESARLRSLCLDHLLVQVPLRVRSGDVVLTLWEHSSYFRGLYDILWQKGGKIVQAYSMGGASSATLPFRYSIFCSRAMMEQSVKRLTERDGDFYGPQSRKMWRVMPPFFPVEDEKSAKRQSAENLKKSQKRKSEQSAENSAKNQQSLTENSTENQTENPTPRPALYLGRIQVEKGAWEFYRVAYYNQEREFWMAGQGEAWIHGRRAGAGDLPLQGRGCLAIARCGQDPLWINLADVPNLVYHGFANPEKRRRLMTEAGALIQLSQYEEPYGWNVVEAHLCGLATITTKTGAFLETVEPGVDGFHLPVEVSHDKTPAAVRSLLCEAEGLDKAAIAEKARKFYDPQVLAPQLIEYMRLVADLSPEEDYLLKR